jgi:hypothetical protein
MIIYVYNAFSVCGGGGAIFVVYAGVYGVYDGDHDLCDADVYGAHLSSPFSTDPVLHLVTPQFALLY